MTAPFPVDRIFFISLKKTPQRTKRAVQHFKEIGLVDLNCNEPELIFANDGNKIQHGICNSIKKAKRLQKTSMSEAGCFASHRSIWLKMIAEGIQTALILEDDAVFDIAKTNNLIQNFNKMPDYDFMNLGWQYHKNPPVQKIERIRIESLPDLWKGDGMWLTHSYCLSLHGAKIFESNTRIQYGGLDWQLSGIQTKMEKSYGFNPKIVSQLKLSASNRSTIRHTQ